MFRLKSPNKKKYRGFQVEIEHDGLYGWHGHVWRKCTIIASAYGAASATAAAAELKKAIDDIHAARGVLS